MAKKLQEDVISSISSRLRELPIRLPRRLGESAGASVKENYLVELLHKDPGVFLERYGYQLSESERLEFDSLRIDDFEVDHYLKQLESGDRNKEVLSRNRRLALMNRLEAEGDFFSEEAMRQRAPELHKLHMGDASSRSPSGPLEEGDMLGRLERQVIQQEDRLAAAQAAAAQKQSQREEEEETTDDEGADDKATYQGQDQNMAVHERSADEVHVEGASGSNGGASCDAKEDFENFLSEMKSRFLAGKDSSFIDYTAVDADASLDEDWAAVADQDAQERYFDAD
ncbi:hypothetical protein COCOBI_03-4720 [Coccomyxa sp. Obi]|nr:hypothetical protein COCOBI_03-4720 [Coccomyxa sp. Obi]